MQHTGTLKNWKDDKGFGFIKPSQGGPDVFAHVKSFQNRSRRPKAGDLLFYKLVTESNGKQRATSIIYCGEKNKPANGSYSASGLTIAFVVALAFLLAVCGLGLFGQIPSVLVGLYLGASVTAFVMYWHDKSAARKGRWRTKESTLLFCGLLGGWPGALVAQQLFRHKSSKTEFQVAFWLSVLINCALLGGLLDQTGALHLSALI